MSIVNFVWKRSDDTEVNTKLHVMDLTEAAGHRRDGDMFIFHIMPIRGVPPQEQWEALAKADEDPISFWKQAHCQYPNMNLPFQLHDGSDESWIAAFQKWAQSDLETLAGGGGGGGEQPVCRITIAGVSEGSTFTVKCATVNHG